MPVTKKKRFIGAFTTEFFVDRNGTMYQEWQLGYGNIFSAMLSEINGLTATQKVMDKTDEWFFYLSDIKIFNDPSNSVNDYVCGIFNWVKLGLRTEWQKLSTMTTRPNLKDPDESEQQKAHFYMRIHDGLFLLESTGHIITPRRIEDYFVTKAAQTSSTNSLRQIVFHEIVRPDILREISSMSKIRLARVRLKVESSVNYDTNHVFGQLQEWARPGDVNYVDIVAGKEYARVDGVDTSWVVRMMRQYVLGQPNVKQAVIEGNKADGSPDKVKLTGAEQKYLGKFDTDGSGQILTEQMFDYMINIGQNPS